MSTRARVCCTIGVASSTQTAVPIPFFLYFGSVICGTDKLPTDFAVVMMSSNTTPMYATPYRNSIKRLASVQRHHHLLLPILHVVPHPLTRRLGHRTTPKAMTARMVQRTTGTMLLRMQTVKTGRKSGLSSKDNRRHKRCTTEHVDAAGHSADFNPCGRVPFANREGRGH